MSLSRETVVQNLHDVCGNSKSKTAILNAVRKPKSYQQVAKELQKNETYCSRVLNEMLVNGLAQTEGERGVFRQTPIVRKLDIPAILRQAESATGKKSKPVPVSPKIIVKKVPNFEEALDYEDIDPVIQKDCFPLEKPYRMEVGEAYLTLENVIKNELNLQSTLVGMDVIKEASKVGLFRRQDGGEEQGLTQLFNASVMWLRNPAHHYKKDMPRSDSLKMIFFADYLIKLVRRQKKLNKL